ncbi:MAG: YidC/Oxa1 family insertase periplasmic-domain containing protein [Planctomycetes bacterium]|nr:YidC/Oxa1 family insertase periplasmic-domain containing protein [Planctomycetota bacterium]
MTPQARRRLIPVIVLFLVGSILSVLIFGPKRPEKPKDQPVHETPKEVVEQKPSATVEKAAIDAPPEVAEVANENLKPFEVLHLVTYLETPDDVVLGSLSDYENWKMEVAFTRNGASISSIRFSDIYETVDGKLAWNKYRQYGGKQPSIDELYLLTSTFHSNGFTAPVLSAYQVVINDQKLNLTTANVWKQTNVTMDSVSYEATIVDENKNTIAVVYRTWTLSEGYGLHVQQGIKNLTGQQCSVQWMQYGPPSLTVDRSRYMDRRRFRFGWELSDEFDPNHAAPIQSNDFLYEFADTTKDVETTLWPTEATIEDASKLSWFASTNRYFSLAVMPNIDDKGIGNRIITDKISSIRCRVWGASPTEYVTTGLYSPAKIIASGESFDLTMDVYAGPLQRSVLDNEQPYVALNMRDMVLYQMSSMCAICTFQWLADFLAVVLTTLDQYVVFDWGLAIILLVLIVRSILHPITKKSQINMQRFGKVMQKLKPEIDKLKQKYPNDPKRVQSEQMALMQKYGVNPYQMLGCLPMFLQMPIWIALYALLYFMFDIRQEPAFFGIFQLIGEWPFLADLSSADHFFGKFDEPKHFLLWNITGINLLPILMGVIFFIQQKYMSPQSMATTPEQASQQKIMRVMMVVLFPLMLYSAPSGLTLYILTSSTVGILESRRIRNHIDELPIEPKPTGQPTRGGKKSKDKQGRAWSDAMDARRKKVQNKAKKQNFKKRG